MNLDANCYLCGYVFRFHWNSLGWSLLLTLSLIAAGVLPAAEVSIDSEATAAQQLKQLNDQTIIESRLLLDTEWDHFKHGAEKATWTLAGLWGWPVSEW